MSITASTIVSQMSAALDAEGSDYYTFANDYMPAINYGIDQVIRVINSKFGGTKFPEESLRELVQARVWRTNVYGRISMPSTTWSVLGVYPEIEYDVHTTGDALLPTAPANKYQSDIITNAVFIRSNYTAKRLNPDEFDDVDSNPLAAGYGTGKSVCIKEYAWCEMETYGLNNADDWYPSGKFEIAIKPILDQKIVGLRILKNPTKVTATNSVLEFPISMQTIITDYALLYIAIKQGDHTNVYGVAVDELDKQLLMAL